MDCVGSFHHHLVLPGVAEVIVVAEPLTGVRDVGELELDFMQFFVGPVLEVHPVQGVPDPELVKVAVRPAHRLLEDHVELVEPERAGDKHPAPDLRPVIQQSDMQPEDIGGRVHRHERRVAAPAFAWVRRPDFDERSCRRSHGGSVQVLARHAQKGH